MFIAWVGSVQQLAVQQLALGLRAVRAAPCARSPIPQAAVATLLLALVPALVLPACAPVDTPPSPGSPPTVIMVVRHAEDGAGDPDNPDLTRAGQERAQALAHVFAHTEVAAIYSTQFNRTQQTVAPLAAAQDVPITTLTVTGENFNTHADSLAVRIIRHHAGGTVVVAGHSNTVPLIVAALGGPALDNLDETAFGDLFTLVRGDTGARLYRAQFGTE